MEKIILVDSYGFFYKAHYAFFSNPLVNKKGKVTSIIYSFLNIIYGIFKERKFQQLICVLDTKGPTHRHSVYKDYKANRPPMPDDLKKQIEVVKNLLELMGIPMILKRGYEADDIIAHYALAAKKNMEKEVEIFSSDKDLLQLVDKQTVILTHDKKGQGFLVIDREGVKKKMSVFPEEVADYLSLLGDSSDNIPGVSGIGKVGAEKLITRYQSIENIYKNIDSLNLSSRQKEKILVGKESAFLSKELILLNKYVPELPRLDEIDFKAVQVEKLIKVFEELEFTSFIKKFNLASFLSQETKITFKEIFEKKHNDSSLLEQGPSPIKIPTFERKEIFFKDLDEIIEKINQEGEFVFDLETTALDVFSAKVVAIVFVFNDYSSYYLRVLDDFLEDHLEKNTLERLKPIFENSQIKKVGHNLKFEYSILRARGIILRGISYDTMVIEYFKDPDKNLFNLENMILGYFNYSKVKFKELLKKENSILNIEKESLKNYTFEDGEFTFLIKEAQKKWVKTEGEELYLKLDLPFIEVLGEMEYQGVLIDSKVLNKIEKLLLEEIKKVRAKIYQLAGEEFNINSTKQLQVILFEKLKIKPIKKMKTGFSTDNFVLEKLAGEYRIAEDLVLYRKYSKLLNTYVHTLPDLICEKTKRVHTHYNQTVASTGRLSSNNPNLQNIPVGRESHGIRQAFIAPPNYDLVSIDYSQVELRVLAFLSQDEVLLKAYRDDLDIHKKTASLLFSKSLDAITMEERNVAKVINFSVIYGISPYSLSQDLKITYAEAAYFIKIYFSSYSGVKVYKDEVLNDVREKGWVKTYFGRKRFIKNILVSNDSIKSRAERIAFNTVIQGTASDIIKWAMLRIHRKIKEKIIQAQMVLQVHDELVFYIKKEGAKKNIQLITKELVNIKPFDKILKVNVCQGSFWDK